MKPIALLPIIFLLCIVLLLSFAYMQKDKDMKFTKATLQQDESTQQQDESVLQQTEPVGGNRDEHGCLGPAGYTYDTELDACVRVWELEGKNVQHAAQLAVSSLPIDENNVRYTDIEVMALRCVGCFDVTLEKNGERVLVEIRNWEIVATNFE